MAYTGEHANILNCLTKDCLEPRYSQNNSPRRQYNYIPLIPRLLAFYRSQRQAKRLKEYPTVVREARDTDRACKDIWNGKLIRELEDQGYFREPTDLALQLSLDGMQLVTARYSHEATPVAIFNLNLPPQERIKKENILISFVIPGPGKYKNLDSYLFPLIEELQQLSQGKAAWDADSNGNFILRAHVALVTGDGPATAEAMGMKRPGNALSPCRSCEIHAIQGNNSTYYVANVDEDGEITYQRPRSDLRGDIDDAMDGGADLQQILGMSFNTNCPLLSDF